MSCATVSNAYICLATSTGNINCSGNPGTSGTPSTLLVCSDTGTNPPLSRCGPRNPDGTYDCNLGTINGNTTTLTVYNAVCEQLSTDDPTAPDYNYTSCIFTGVPSEQFILSQVNPVTGVGSCVVGAGGSPSTCASGIGGGILPEPPTPPSNAGNDIFVPVPFIPPVSAFCPGAKVNIQTGARQAFRQPPPRLPPPPITYYQVYGQALTPCGNPIPVIYIMDSLGRLISATPYYNN